MDVVASPPAVPWAPRHEDVFVSPPDPGHASQHGSQPSATLGFVRDCAPSSVLLLRNCRHMARSMLS